MNFVRKFSYLVLVMGLLLPCASVAETVKTPPVSAEQVRLSYAPVVKRVAPAVVNIYTAKVVRQRVISPLFDDPFFNQFFGGGFPHGMTRERMENALGSGVIIRPDGLIVTNNHVIAGADEIAVVLSDHREFEARLVTTDDRTDLAVLRIDAKGEALPYLELKDSDNAEVGDLVLAVGDPFGVGQTVTSGIISGLARTSVDINDINYFIQTDAAINPGNSGGALVTMDGKLIGINSAIFSRSGGSMGIGFAIPSNMVRAAVSAVASGQKNVVRPWTGIEGQGVTPEVAVSLSLPRPSGVLVNGLHEGSPARGAGLKTGDVILAVNGKSVEDPSAFRYRIATLPVGSEASLDVLRKGQKLNLTMKLIVPPENPPRDETRVKGRNPLTGAVIANLSPAVSEEIGLRGIDRGVVVLKLIDGAAASNVGFQPGDIIQRINGVETNSVSETLEALQNRRQGGWRIVLRRGDNVINLMVGG
ncbi:MAG: Do family serine endopeptidase [Alphaproteobacteria bacterium]|nr:Do family serine endopeptidase [Alphaproteobacteria bacterium]